MINNNRLVDRYYNQLINYGGYALPRWLVIEDLKQITAATALIDLYLLTCEEISTEDAYLHLSIACFYEHGLP